MQETFVKKSTKKTREKNLQELSVDVQGVPQNMTVGK